MTILNEDNLFPEFNAYFPDSSGFPEAALDQIPKELLTAIDSGNEIFFSCLLNSFPLLYKLLVSDCSRVYLLESLATDIDLNGNIIEHRFYRWGLKCGHKLITIRIPELNPSDELSKRYHKESLHCLPVEFAAFYEKMDGMSLSEGIEPYGMNLPLSFGDWRELTAYFSDRALSPPSLKKIYTENAGSDFRVFIACSGGNLVVCNVASSKRKLYLLDDVNYKQLAQPAQELDLYFVSALKGETENPILA